MIADEALAIAGLGLDQLQEGEAIAGALAEMATRVARLARPAQRRNRDAPRRPITVLAFVKELKPFLPEDSTLAQEPLDVLLAWEAFVCAGNYLRKLEPALECAYNQHAPMRADNPASAAICEALERCFDRGRAILADAYTFVHHLKAHGVPSASALFQGALAALGEEVRASTHRLVGQVREGLKRSPSPAERESATSSAILLPITAPLDEHAFNELCEFLRDSEAIIERAYNAYCEFRQDDPKAVAPHLDEIWYDAIENTCPWRPMIDGTFTHADHLRAWGIDPLTYVTGRAAEVSTKSNAAAIIQTTSLPLASRQEAQPRALGSGEHPPRKRQAANAEDLLKPVQHELTRVFVRYMEHGDRARVEKEIRAMKWTAQQKQAALEGFWVCAGKSSAPPPPPSEDRILSVGAPANSTPRNLPSARARSIARARRGSQRSTTAGQGVPPTPR